MRRGAPQSWRVLSWRICRGPRCLGGLARELRLLAQNNVGDALEAVYGVAEADGRRQVNAEGQQPCVDVLVGDDIVPADPFQTIDRGGVGKLMDCGGSERAARAITTALSPERMILIQMILKRPIQNSAVCSTSIRFSPVMFWMT